MNKIILLSVLGGILLLAIIIYFVFKRNYFNKYKYVRLVKYNDNMTIDISYIKKDQFNQNNDIIINPKHIYDFKGYKSIIITSKANESINPIDFESKFDTKDYKSAIRSKLIQETFASLKQEKFDKLMLLLFVNIIQLLAIVYLLYTLLGDKL